MSDLATSAYINGQWVTTGKTFDVTNPADGSLVGKVQDCGIPEVQKAIGKKNLNLI